MPRRRRTIFAAPPTVSAVGALSVADTRYEAVAALTPGKGHVLHLTLDQANNLVGVSVDGGAATTAATSGTFNAQTGGLYLGAGLVDGVVQSTAQTGYIGYAAVYNGLLSGAALTAGKAAAAAWLAPVLTLPPTLAVAASGTTVFTVTPYVQDPAGYGWQITAATALDGNVTVASATATTVSLTTVAAAGATTSFRVTVQSLHPMAPSSSMVVQVVIGATRFSNGFLYRRRCLIPSARVAAAADHIWLFHETTASFVRAATASFVARFEREDGTRLDHEVMFYDPLTGELTARVRIPGLSTTADTRIWLYYGDTTVEQPASDLWNSGSYFYVVDLPTGRDQVTANPAFTSANVVSAANGTGATFNGVDSSVRQGDTTGFSGWAAATWQLYVQPSGMVGTNKGYFAQGPFNANDTDHGIVFRNAPTGARGAAANPLIWGLKVGSGWMLYESSPNKHATAGTYYWLVWQSGSLPKLYIDGVEDTPTWVGSVVGSIYTQNAALAGVTTAGSGALVIGASSWDSVQGGFNGLMGGQVRAQSAAMTAGQILTEYRNYSDPQTFYGLGGEDVAGDSTAAPTAAPIAITASAGVAYPGDIDVLAAAYDPDGSLSITSAGQAPHGSATVVSSKIRYTPAENFSGVDRWAYAISDGAKSSTGYILAAVTGQTTVPVAELPVPVRSITGVSNYAELTAYLGGTYTDPILGAIGQPAAGDHVFLDDGNYAGAINPGDNLTIGKNGTATNPIVFRAANRLGAVIMVKITLTGDYLYLYGLKFDFDSTSASNLCGRAVINGANHCKILRCEFTGWWGDNTNTAWTNGHAIQFSSAAVGADPGTGTEIGYCFIHDPHFWSTAEQNNTDTTKQPLRIFLRAYGKTVARFHKNAFIHHCAFASTIPRPKPSTFVNGVFTSNYGSGQADLIEIGDNNPNFPQADPTNPVVQSGWRIEDCIFDGTGVGFGLSGDIDLDASGVIDQKIGGQTWKRCTFRNLKSARAGAKQGRVDIRANALTRYESCWFDAPLGIQGSFHQIVGNKLNSGGGCWLITGDEAWNIYSDGGHQPCHMVRCTGNVGILDVGRHFSTQDVACDSNIIEAHTGQIKVQQTTYGTWATVTPGNLESGTTYTATASETATVPTAPLDNATVGPNAALGGFALGPTYTDQWSLFTTTHATIAQLTTGVTLTAGPTLASGDLEHIQIVSKQAWAGDFKATFDMTRLDASAGSTIQESGLFYFLMTGDGTAGHPADLTTWTADGATRFENSSTGYRMSFDPRGTDTNNAGQIRLRVFPGAVQILSTAAPNTQPGQFPFTQNTTYTCTVQRSGTTFTFTRRPTAGGATLTMPPKTDTNLDNANAGRFIFRMMAGRSFKIENFSVATA